MKRNLLHTPEGVRDIYNGECAQKLHIQNCIHNVINKIAIEKDFAKSGFRIINNCGDDGGQEVKHIHYHVLAGKKLPLYEHMEK